jgi:hypothetical protein
LTIYGHKHGLRSAHAHCCAKLFFCFGWSERKHGDFATMLFNKLHGCFNSALFVGAYGEAKKCSVNLLPIVGDIDTCTRCGYSLYANKNLHDRIID